MLEYLKLQNVGPAEEMELDLGTRLNVLTGDNGLGKSFLLDVIWFISTGCWPADINPDISTGGVAVPAEGKEGGISFTLRPPSVPDYTFDYGSREWVPPVEEQHFVNYHLPENLLIYLMSDGSCAVYDPLRNQNRQEFSIRPSEKPQAFVFDSNQVWDGLKTEEGKWLCNGLIRDWATWQNKGGEAFEFLKKVLEILSPSKDDVIVPGELTRISLDDVRDIPGIKMPYDGEVAVTHASSGIRRILSFAYLMVWAWQEHQLAAKLTRMPIKRTFRVLIDEIDAHLHPSWQRKIVPAMLELNSMLPEQVQFQIIGSTHSPLVMSSLEPLFDAKTDAWFDLDLVGENGQRKVKLTKREFEILGEAGEWLTSEAFDMDSSGSLEAEQVMKEAEIAMESPDFNYEKAKELYDKLVKLLPADDTFFMRWRMVGKQKGWWK